MRWIVFILPLFLLNCSVEEVQSAKTARITIASDFLKSGDTSLFEGWSKANGIRIRILSMDDKALLNVIDSAKYNPEIDLFIGKSLMSAQQLHRSQVFQKLQNPESGFYDSKEYRFFALALDPYIFEPHTDSSIVAKTYSELTKRKFHCALSEDDEIPFLSAFLSRMDRARTYNWMTEYVDHKDSTQNSEFSLKRYSKTEHRQSITFPGKRVSGTIYDVVYIGIIRQTENIGACRSFINHYRKPKANEFLCWKLRHIALSNPSNIDLFRKKPEDLLQYFDMIKRMLKKSEEKRSQKLANWI